MAPLHATARGGCGTPFDELSRSEIIEKICDFASRWRWIVGSKLVNFFERFADPFVDVIIDVGVSEALAKLLAYYGKWVGRSPSRRERWLIKSAFFIVVYALSV